MHEKKVWTLGELAALVDAKIQGDPSVAVRGLATLSTASTSQLSFLDNPRYYQHLANTKAAGVLLAEKYAAECPVTALITPQPYLAFAKLTHVFNDKLAIEAGIHPSATVDPTAQIDASAAIGPGCIIGKNVIIRKGCVLSANCVLSDLVEIDADTYFYPQVTVYHAVKIGKRCIIHSGAVIGSDGFGFARDKQNWQKIVHLGTVRIEDDVEIGANTTIDRGVLNDTVIESSVKLDNLIQVAHNVHIGAGTVIAGCTGIAGSTKIGKGCMIGGGVGIAGHLSIADFVVISGMAMITKSIFRRGIYSSGIPAIENSNWRKNIIQLRHLGKLNDRVAWLENKIEELTKQKEFTDEN